LIAACTCSALADCVSVCSAIEVIAPAVRSTAPTIPVSDSPTFSESWAPSETRREDSLMSWVISFAASLDRSASLRTSSATTAKPRPC